MHLRSRQDQVVTLGGQAFHLSEGETLHTESSYKYTTKGVQTLAERAGYRQERYWTDRRHYFGVWYFSTC